MSGISYTSPRFQAIDQYGRAMVGATLYTYQNKTTTPSPTWRDKEQSAYNTNPIELDARGEAVVWLDPAQVYTFVLRDWHGALVWSQDDIAGSASQLDVQAVVERLADADDPGNGADMVGVSDELSQKWRLNNFLGNFGPTYLQFGAIRQITSGSGWSWINDAAHLPRGFTGQPSVNGNGDIVIGFDKTVPKVGGLVVCPDETFALFGITVGASVGLSSATITMRKSMGLYVNLAAKTLDVEAYFRNRVSMTENPDGTFTISHPSSPSSYVAPLLSQNHDYTGRVSALVTGATDTTITIAPVIPLNGSIVFDGTNWIVNTAAKEKPTLNFSNGILTVNHTQGSQNQVTFALISPRRSTAPVDITVGSQSHSAFTVEFRNAESGALLSSVPAGAGFIYQRNIQVTAETPTGVFFLTRQDVRLNANDVYLGSANLWILGMQRAAP